MRILFATTRGTGHFYPLIPYAQELVRCGHDAAFASRIDLAPKISSLGFEHIVLGAPDQTELEAIWARTKGLPEEMVIEIYIRETFGGVTARAALPAVRAAMTDWKPDLVVRETVEFSSIVAANEVGIPHARVEVHAAQGEEKYSGIFLEALEALREGIGLQPDNARCFLEEPSFTSFPIALDGMVSRRGRPNFRVGPPKTDVLSTTADPDWDDGEDLPLIYMTFGTEVQNMDDAVSIYPMALQAVADLPIRVFLTTGKPIDADLLGPVPANTKVRTFVPQDQVFPKASAVIHHGGSGTLLGCLAAGLPMVVTPLFADQPTNAKIVEEAGAGLAVLDPTPGKITTAMKAILAKDCYRLAACAIAEEMAGLPKIDAAVSELLKHCSR